MPKTPSSQSKVQSKIPDGVYGFSWGGLLIPPIWGPFNRVWISLIWLIPVVGWVVAPFLLAFKGREWAWKAKKWKSVEEFRQVQKNWSIVSPILFFILILPILLFSLAFSTIFSLGVLTSGNPAMQIEKANETVDRMDAETVLRAVENYRGVKKKYPFGMHSGEQIPVSAFVQELAREQYVKDSFAVRLQEKDLYVLPPMSKNDMLKVCYPSKVFSDDVCVTMDAETGTQTR